MYLIVRRVTLAFACVILGTTASWASTLYVDGVDATCAGQSPCYRLIQDAIDEMGPGDTVRVSAGNYHEQVNIIGKRGTSAAPIVLEADPAAANSVFITSPRGACTVGYGIAIARSSFVTVRGITVASSPGAGILLRGGASANDEIQLEGNRLVANGSNTCEGGIRIGTANRDVAIANNLIYSNGRNGISIRRQPADSSVEIVSNTIVGNTWNGVSVAPGAKVRIANNILLMNGPPQGRSSRYGRGVFRAGRRVQTTDIVLRNNLLCGNRGAEISAGLLDQSDDSNLTPTGTEGPGTDAAAGCDDLTKLFVAMSGSDATNGTLDDNFELTPGSPALDAGADLLTISQLLNEATLRADYTSTSVRPSDGDNVPGSRFDIGAVERRAAPSAPAPQFRIGIEATPVTTTTGAAVDLQGVLLDPLLSVSSWEWDFGDGRTAAGQNANVVYDVAGIFVVTLKAVASDGTQITTDTAITVFGSNGESLPALEVPARFGDVNEDGIVTLEDAYLVAKHTSQLQLLPDRVVPAADIDLDGKITFEDAKLLAEAVIEDRQLPTRLFPDAGQPGRLVTLVAPELLETSGVFQIEVAGVPTPPPVRIVPGYLTFAIPLGITQQGPVEIALLHNGVVVRTLPFSIEPATQLPVDPVAAVDQLLAEVDALLTNYRSALQELLTALGVPSDEQAILLAMVETSNAEIAQGAVDLRRLLQQPGGAELAQVFLQYAYANGLAPGALGTSSIVGACVQGVAGVAGTADSHLALLCNVKTIAARVAAVGVWVSGTCDGLLLTAGAAAAVGNEPLAAALAAAWISYCGPAEAAVDVIAILNDIVAKADADFVLTASPDTPEPGEASVIEGKLTVIGVDDLCSTAGVGGNEAITRYIAKLATKRLMKRKVALRALAKAIEVFSKEAEKKLVEKVESVVGQVVGAAGLGNALKAAADAICTIAGTGEPLDLRPILLGPAPSVGTLEFSGDGLEARFTCPAPGEPQAPDVAFAASKTLCDHTENQDVVIVCAAREVTITIGDNGNLLDDIFEVQIEGMTVLTSSQPTRGVSTTVLLPVGEHDVQMIGRAAPDGVGTYFINFSGATVIGGAPLSGSDLTPGVVKVFRISVM